MTYINSPTNRAKIDALLENGYVELETKEELMDYSIGSHIKYQMKNGELMKGGYLESIGQKSFRYVDIDDLESEPVRVAFKKVNKMYIGEPTRLSNRKGKKTKFPVKIGNKVIYYAKDKFDKRRFKYTTRYEQLEKWYEKYGEIYNQ